MFEPTDATRPALASTAIAAAALAVLVLLPGCGLVPKSRLEECHRVSQAIRADNARLKDLTLELRTQNQDLSQRAVDDARQIAAKDEANEQLLRSVQAYQDERDKLAAAYQALERRVRMAVNPYPAARPAALKALVSAHPDWSFDEKAMVLSVPTDRLFEKGSDVLTSSAASILKDLADELSGIVSEGLALEVVGPAAAPPVVRAGFNPGGNDAEKTADRIAAASGRFLSAARAARVRDRLLNGTGLKPENVRIAPPSRLAGAGLDGAEGRIVIRPAGNARE